MKFGILITNNGTHSSEKWASAAANRIVEISPEISEERLIAAQRLQAGIAEVLLGHHEATKIEVLTALNTNPELHFKSPDLHSPGPLAAQAISAIQNVAVGTPWEAAFKEPQTVDAIYNIIGQSLVDLKHVERLHFADNNPHVAVAQTYKAAPTGILIIPASTLV